MKRMMIFGCNVELSPCRNEPCNKLNTAEQNSINESLLTELLLKERFAMIEKKNLDELASELEPELYHTPASDTLAKRLASDSTVPFVPCTKRRTGTE